MGNGSINEQWKPVEFNFDFTNNYRMEVSNFGRIRTFNKVSNGNIIQGTMIGGYRIIRLKFYRQRHEKVQAKLTNLQQQVFKLAGKLKQQVNSNKDKQTISETTKLLASFKKSVSKKFQNDLRERTINYHALIHRLVAEYFLPLHKADETIVAHLDHNKMNNNVPNLKWMTPEENYAHQQKSPNVIKLKKERQHNHLLNSNTAKLTITRVMLLKKLLNEGKSMKQLVKSFKITDTQILRIKRGENWGYVPAAT